MNLFHSSWPPIQLPFKNATSTVEFLSFLPLSLLPTSSAYLPLSRVFSYQSKLIYSYIHTSFLSLNSFKYIIKEGIIYGWFMLRFNRKQQNSVKQLSFNKKIKINFFKLKKKRNYWANVFPHPLSSATNYRCLRPGTWPLFLFTILFPVLNTELIIVVEVVEIIPSQILKGWKTSIYIKLFINVCE